MNFSQFIRSVGQISIKSRMGLCPKTKINSLLVEDLEHRFLNMESIKDKSKSFVFFDNIIPKSPNYIFQDNVTGTNLLIYFPVHSQSINFYEITKDLEITEISWSLTSSKLQSLITKKVFFRDQDELELEEEKIITDNSGADLLHSTLIYEKQTEILEHAEVEKIRKVLIKQKKYPVNTQPNLLAYELSEQLKDCENIINWPYKKIDFYYRNQNGRTETYERIQIFPTKQDNLIGSVIRSPKSSLEELRRLAFESKENIKKSYLGDSLSKTKNE